jgi:hypothetical protein
VVANVENLCLGLAFPIQHPLAIVPDPPKPKRKLTPKTK